ncbi:hypothetical protein TNCV_372891 [Trichonephila clavipes]|nr:hypothetical protein TNCV_372891 [Trichonephila clavipes]
MEHEIAFTLHLAMYHTHTQEADLGDYITFMMNFRGVLIRLKPSEVIELETVYAVNIIDVMMEILPYHDPHDVPWFERFSYFEPADLDSEFMEQEAAKGKGAFVQALWTQYAISKLYFLVYKAWRRYGAQNLTTWTRLVQAVLDGCFGQIVSSKCQTRVRFASARCTGRKRRNAAMHFTCVASSDTWM